MDCEHIEEYLKRGFTNDKILALLALIAGGCCKQTHT